MGGKSSLKTCNSSLPFIRPIPHKDYSYQIRFQVGLVRLWCLMLLSTTFQLHRGGQFYCRKSLTNFIT